MQGADDERGTTIISSPSLLYGQTRLETYSDNPFHSDPCDDDYKVTPEPKKRKQQHGEQYRNLVAFFICGLLNNYSYVVMLSAAEHLIEGQTGLVLLADILPTLIIKLTAPFYMHQIPYNIRVIIVAVFAVASFQTVAWIPGSYLKLIGVCFASISSGFGEITFLAMTSHYHEFVTLVNFPTLFSYTRNTVAAWSSGTGGAGVFGALSYLALTSWFRLTPFATLNVITVLPFLILFSVFVLMSGNHAPRGRFCSLTVHNEKTGEDGNGSLTFRERVRQLVPLLKYMIPLFIVYYSEYVINQGVAPNLTFRRNGVIAVKDTYTYYQFLYQSGVFVSRSSVHIFPIRRVWIPCMLQAVNLVLLFTDAYFRIIPVIWIIFAIIFYEGLLGGAGYVNSFYRISKEVDPRYKEFSMGVAAVADTIGISLAGVTSIWLQPWLKKHQYRRGF